MSLFSKVFVSVSLLCERVLCWVARAQDLDKVALVWLADLQLKELTLCWALDESTLDLETSAYICLLDIFEVLEVLSENYLQPCYLTCRLPEDP